MVGAKAALDADFISLSLSRFLIFLWYWPIFFCHSLSFLPFSIKLSMSFFFASQQWWRLTIHHLLSSGNVVWLSSPSLSRLFLVVSSVSFFFSLYYSSIRVGTAKSVVVIHPIERQLLNILVLLCFPFLYASSSILFFSFSSSFGSIVDDDDDDDLSLSHSLSLCMW
jgi:hypothetical protein